MELVDGQVNFYEVLCLVCPSLVLKVHIEQRPVAVEARSYIESLSMKMISTSLVSDN